MSNWKVGWWARLTGHTTCMTCGELIATTTITDPAGTRPACTYCAEWVAAGSPEDYDLDPYWAALDALPWLLRHRPSVRQLNCSAATYREVAHDPQARADAYDQLRAEYSAALWPVRYAYNAGQNFSSADATSWLLNTVDRANRSYGWTRPKVAALAALVGIVAWLATFVTLALSAGLLSIATIAYTAVGGAAITADYIAGRRQAASPSEPD